MSLNEVRPRRPEQFCSVEIEGYWISLCLNEVRPRRPEQWKKMGACKLYKAVSMKSGLEGRNNDERGQDPVAYLIVSMKSGLEGRNNGVGGHDPLYHR